MREKKLSAMKTLLILLLPLCGFGQVHKPTSYSEYFEIYYSFETDVNGGVGCSGQDGNSGFDKDFWMKDLRKTYNWYKTHITYISIAKTDSLQYYSDYKNGKFTATVTYYKPVIHGKNKNY